MRDEISASKYREFRRRAIQNTLKDVLVSDKWEVEEWKRSPEFRTRMRCLHDRDAAARAQWRSAEFVLIRDGGKERRVEDEQRRAERVEGIGTQAAL